MAGEMRMVLACMCLPDSGLPASCEVVLSCYLPRRCRFTLHALALGSPRAVAELWSRFVTTLRLAYWEPLQALPRMRLGPKQQPAGQQPGAQQQQQRDGAAGSEAADGNAEDSGSGSGGAGGTPEAPDLSLSLLHQKLQLLDLCIHLQQQRRQQSQGEQQQQGQLEPAGGCQLDDALDRLAAGAEDWENGWGTEDANGAGQASPVSSSRSSYHSARTASRGSSPSPDKQQKQQQQSAAEPADAAGAAAAASAVAEDEPQGAVGTLPGASLHLHPDRPLRVPAVQEPPVQTEDALAEHQAALAALPAAAADDDGGALRAQLQGRMLLSDMQAFKAANPGCCLLGGHVLGCGPALLVPWYIRCGLAAASAQQQSSWHVSSATLLLSVPADFVRWHSPKDCCKAEDGWRLSGRMAAEVRPACLLRLFCSSCRPCSLLCVHPNPTHTMLPCDVALDRATHGSGCGQPRRRCLQLASGR